MVRCPDCGTRNIGNLYCTKCGGDLYAKHRRPERSFVSIFDRPLVLK